LYHKKYNVSNVQKATGGSLSLWELMPSYSHGLATADVTRPPGLLSNILSWKTQFVK